MMSSERRKAPPAIPARARHVRLWIALARALIIRALLRVYPPVRKLSVIKISERIVR